MKRLIAVGLFASLLSGCYSMTMGLSPYIDPDQVHFNPVKGQFIQHFDDSEGTAFLFWGLVKQGNPRPERIFARYVERGEKIANLRITTQSSFVDGLISTITLGIYNPWTIHYEGDIVKP